MQSIVSDFMLAAYGQATTYKAKADFFEKLHSAIGRQPQLGVVALPVLKKGLVEKDDPKNTFGVPMVALFCLNETFAHDPAIMDEGLATTLARLYTSPKQEAESLGEVVDESGLILSAILEKRPDLRSVFFSEAMQAAKSPDAFRRNQGFRILAEIIRVEPEKTQAILPLARREIRNKGAHPGAVHCFANMVFSRPDVISPREVHIIRQISRDETRDDHAVALDFLDEWGASLRRALANQRIERLTVQPAREGNAPLRALTAQLAKIAQG